MSDLVDIKQLPIFSATPTMPSVDVPLINFSALESLKMRLSADPMFGELVARFFRGLPIRVDGIFSFILNKFDNSGIENILINACIDASFFTTIVGEKVYSLQEMSVARRISTKFDTEIPSGILYTFQSLTGELIPISPTIASLLRGLNEYQLYVLLKLFDSLEISNIESYEILNELRSLLIHEINIPGLSSQNRALFTSVHGPRRLHVASRLDEFPDSNLQMQFIESERRLGNQGLNVETRQIQQNTLGNLGKVAESIIRFRTEDPEAFELIRLSDVLKIYGNVAKSLSAWRNGKPNANLDFAFSLENGKDLGILDFTVLGIAWMLIRYSIPSFDPDKCDGIEERLMSYKPIECFMELDELMNTIGVRNLGTLVNGISGSYPNLRTDLIDDAVKSFDNGDVNSLLSQIEVLAGRILELNRELIIDISLFFMTLYQIVNNPDLARISEMTHWNFPLAGNGVTYYADGLKWNGKSMDVYEFKSHASYEPLRTLPKAIRNQLARYVRILAAKNINVGNVVLVDIAAEGVTYQEFPAEKFLEEV